MRYTLRLLTLDQLGRAATLICALELERLERAETAHPYPLGEWPFEIGMWVGKAATPNKLGGPGDSDQQSTHAVLTKWKAGKRDRPIPIETCPWCNRPLQPEGFFLLPPRNPDRLEIYCREPRSPEAKQEFEHLGPCPFHKGTPLPVLAVDEQIYRRLPCFLIATIDKFAALPWVGKTSSLFGNVSTYQLATPSAPAGFWGPAEKGAGGLKIPHGRLLPPALVIQDELHLISGPLGTLAGLYETVIEGLMRPDTASAPPKIIASTPRCDGLRPRSRPCLRAAKCGSSRRPDLSAMTTSFRAPSPTLIKPVSTWASQHQAATSMACCCAPTWG
jgi:hypothetical protein